MWARYAKYLEMTDDIHRSAATMEPHSIFQPRCLRYSSLSTALTAGNGHLTQENYNYPFELSSVNVAALGMNGRIGFIFYFKFLINRKFLSGGS
jgi:hypothetical protein